MRVLLIGPFPPPITGHSVANEYLRSGLKKKNHEITVIDTGQLARIEDSSQQGRLHLSKLFRAIREILWNFKKIWNSDAQIVYMTPGQTFLGFFRYLPYQLICLYKKIPIVLHFHGGFFRQMYSSLDPLRQLLTRNTLTRCAKIIVLGDSLRDLFKGIVDSESITVCENGIEESLILSDSEMEEKIQRWKDSKQNRVLFLSNIIRTKGILDLLDSIQILIDMGLEVHCDIAGAIDKEIEKEFFLKLSSLEDHAIYHGIAEREKKRSLLEGANILCLPTYYPVEGQPISILEAYGTACLVVCTNHAGIKDIFQNGVNGYYCEARNPASIADSILKAFNMPLELTRENRARSQQLYTATAFTERVERVLANLIR